ncbi:MAG: glucose-6-phosphate isomerase [Flavobacteriaceae bacterium]|nr:glucose-6-phosphate isomerase [Flavobacteriaceae bacterium]
MALQSVDPTKTKAWEALKTHFDSVKDAHMKDWFAQDNDRAKTLSMQWEDFYVDYSKNRITAQTLHLFEILAETVGLKDAIERYFEGDRINETEERAVLHTALRAPKSAKIYVDNNDVVPQIYKVRAKIEAFTNAVVDGEKKGFTNKAFTDIVSIGIGGSNLGPSMVVEALKYYKNHLNTHYIHNVDGDHVFEILEQLNPETTLFIIVSKSFSTQETITNANTVKQWFLEQASEADIATHFVAVSSNSELVKKFGIDQENIFPMWNWVGGRFSLWSAVGLSISLALGYSNYEALLHGGYKMDKHFRTRSFDANIPVILSFISIWYNNFFKAETEAIIPYSQHLNSFSAYLQQAIMESNGKQVMRNGKAASFQTGNIIWGAPGTNAQHAFFQLIHQGTKLIPADFIGFANSLYGNKVHQNKLMSSCFAQTEALLKGKTGDEVLFELERLKINDDKIGQLTPFKTFEGNKPTTTILIDQLTPESLGKLIAMYEHKIFVQGVIWNIFSYDQFGVELGKQLEGRILKEIQTSEINKHDASTRKLIDIFKNLTH